MPRLKSGTFQWTALAGDKSPKMGTVPGNQGHLVTLINGLNPCYSGLGTFVFTQSTADRRPHNIKSAEHEKKKLVCCPCVFCLFLFFSFFECPLQLDASLVKYEM